MADTAAPPALPTHGQGLALFDTVLGLLLQKGFTRLRVDTLQHPNDANTTDLAQRWSVRHHFTHGEWELHYEPDRTWNRKKHPDARMVRIRLDRPLPTTQAVISELFGPFIGRYFPALAAPAQRRGGSRKSTFTIGRDGEPRHIP